MARTRRSDQEGRSRCEPDVYSFMTTTPNALVGTINHERMPVLLSTDEKFERWMKGTPTRPSHSSGKVSVAPVRHR